MSNCRKFAPNIFNKSKCSNCFRQKEEHSAEALECNRASRAITRSGYLFVAPDWDFSVPLNRTKRWQRRWFVLYDDGELNYSVDEHPDTVPQGSVDMCKVLEVTGAEQVTGHPHSLALTSPDRVTFIKAASREDARWWAELLAVFPRRHKRNATFPGGRASPSLPQLGRSASPQPPRPRHRSCTGPSPRTNFLTPPLKEEQSSPKEETPNSNATTKITPRPVWLPEPAAALPIEATLRTDYVVSSGSPPTRDKLQCDEKTRARRDWRNERLRDIATALTDRSPESSLALPSEDLLHLKKGWLWMKGDDGDWIRRWWILCGPTLNAYIEQDESGTPAISVELSTITGFNEITTETRYGFQIHWSNSVLTLSAVTAGIRTNWLQALKKAIPNTPDSPPAAAPPATPRSLLLSSDEEYRTASEGGRRGSEDWNELTLSPVSPSPLSKMKERVRGKPRIPRSQSRQSTTDSVSTDEIDCAKECKESAEVELRNSLNRQSAEIDDLKKQLSTAVSEVQNLERELARLKKTESESLVREKQTEDLLLTLEQKERQLNEIIRQAEEKHARDQRTIERQLTEAECTVKESEDRCNLLQRELQAKQCMLDSLQDELNSTKEALAKDSRERLSYKRILGEGDERNRNYKQRIESFIDLTNIDLDTNLADLSEAELIKYCMDLRSRFEKAVAEIRAVKRELREAYLKYDDLELENAKLTDNMSVVQQDAEAHSALMTSRLQDLTNKLQASEKQARILKSKLQDSREKRRSLSLKGRESTSINKEVEDKVGELETKLSAIEKSRTKRKYRRERSSERASPIDDKSLRRLRRKSLDGATTSEPMKLLMRLSALESKMSGVANSCESLNTITRSVSESNLKLEETNDGCNQSDRVFSEAREKINECICQVSSLRGSRSRRAPSPIVEKLSSLEDNLHQLIEILSEHQCGLSNSSGEISMINASASSVVKQLEILLREKLTEISEKKRLLKENGKLDENARQNLLAEKIAYENILLSRIEESLNNPVATDIRCDRLMNREIIATSHLMSALHGKFNGTLDKHAVPNKTSVDYLTKLLSKRLATTIRNVSKCEKLVRRFGLPSAVNLLKDKQKQLHSAWTSYKAIKLPQLADALAIETINLSSDVGCRLRNLDQTSKNEAWTAARNSVNVELIQSEINHVLMRAAQMYEANGTTDHNFFFSFFASERAALELWSDAVEEQLKSEMQRNIDELEEYYQKSVNKLQRQNWRRRVELERNLTPTSSLLSDFADIVAHKALIDSRINVLSGEYVQRSNETSAPNAQSAAAALTVMLENERLWDNCENAELVQINQSLEAEFKCILDYYSDECYSISSQFYLEDIDNALAKIAYEVQQIEKCLDPTGPCIITSVQVNSWQDVYQRCHELLESLITVRDFICSNKFKRASSLENEEDRRPLYLGTEYLSQVENLRAAYRRTIATCEGLRQQGDLEQLQVLCERVLMAMEHWHRRALHDLRESHSIELQSLKQEKEQALAEETQATLAALDAMRKAHEAEVQREVAKFKQELARRQQNEVLELAERLSVKCLEAAALEEQLGSATRQLAHAQQHILQLERNPQLATMQN